MQEMKYCSYKYLLFLLLATFLGCGNSRELLVLDDLRTGEPKVIRFKASRTDITIPTPNLNEEFSLILNSYEDGNLNREIKISAGLNYSDLLAENPGKELSPVESRIDPLLRDAEKIAAQAFPGRERLKINPKFLTDTPPPSADFKVLNNYVSPENYSSVNAGLVSASPICAFYADGAIPLPIRNDPWFIPLIQRLESNFDNIIYPTLKSYFGDEPLVEGIPQIIILMTPVVNMIDTGGRGRVLGFFYAGDLFPASKFPSSNEARIIYIAAPEESGKEALEKFADQLMTGTLAHEFQHMINFNEHVIKDGSSDAEEVWLNEGLSHMAEDITGFGRGNIGRAGTFLSSPVKYPLAASNDSLGTRGGAYLFLRYIFEKFDMQNNAGLFRKITSSSYRGTENISKSLGIEFSKVYTDWLSTLAISGRGISGDPYYSYSEPRIIGSDGRAGPFQIGISIRGENESLTLDGPYTEPFCDVNLKYKPTSASFYSLKAEGKNIIFLTIVSSDPHSSGMILIPNRL